LARDLTIGMVDGRIPNAAYPVDHGRWAQGVPMRWISLAGSRDPPVCSQVFREWQPQQSAALMDYDISKYAREHS